MNYNYQQHSGSRILLAIADTKLRQSIRETLELQDFEVLVVHDTREAVLTLRTHAPRAVVLDFALPFHRSETGYEGVSSLGIITDVDPFLPVLLLAEENVTLNYETGLMADMILRVPVSDRELLESLDTLLSESLRERSLRKSTQLAIQQ